MYRSLFLCLLDLVVHGSLDLVIAGVKEAEAFITSAFQVGPPPTLARPRADL